MPSAPNIAIVAVDHGLFPVAPSLNPSIAADSPLLFATLDMRWDDPDPVASLVRIEKALLAFSPTFGRHECRGPLAYHVFLPRREMGPRPGADGSGAEPLEGCLALAHLIEHAVIDFQCAILRLGRCSGVTGARRDRPNRYDLMIECRDPGIGRLCLALAVSWVTAATEGRGLGEEEGDLLIAARQVHRGPRDGLVPAVFARSLGWSEKRAELALAGLREAGYLDATPYYAINFSGIPAYRISLS